MIFYVMVLDDGADVVFVKKTFSGGVICVTSVNMFLLKG